MIQAYLIGYAFFFFCVMLLWSIFVCRKKNIWAIVLFGFLLRGIFGIIRYHFFPEFYASSIYHFETIGWRWAQEGKILSHFTTGPDFYSWIISCIYLIVPRSKLLIILINSFLSSIIIWNVYYMVFTISTNSKKSKNAAWFVCLLPVLVLQSAVPSREVFIVFFLTAGLLLYLKWLKFHKIKNFILSVILLLLSAGFHGGMLSILAGLFLYEFYILFKESFYSIDKKLLTANTFKVGLALTLFLFIGIWATSSGWGGKLDAFYKNPNPRIIVKKVQQSSHGRAAYPVNLQLHNPSITSLIYNLPLRLIYFLFSPLPWQITSPIDVVGFFNGLIYFFLVVGIMYKYSSSINKGMVSSILLGVIAFVIVFSLAVSNYGTALRHRAKIVPVLICIFYCVGSAKRNNHFLQMVLG